MDGINNLVNAIENSIFKYNIKELNDNINRFIEEISKLLPELEDTSVNNLNEVMKYLNEALYNRDYILYNDILKYELLHILENR